MNQSIKTNEENKLKVFLTTAVFVFTCTVIIGVAMTYFTGKTPKQIASCTTTQNQ